ncbi:hypothetical protein [Hydrogenovibrio kuenenii]|uniref:hypothetical protein n=1 Tax=Hydrogenovibrio kuenenii TaxID=63658 RepID=UPI0004640168|nr:hypothetical protein [Hydrogenovibrio kuenenii]
MKALKPNTFKLISLTTIVGLSLTACSLTPPKSMMDVQADNTFQLNQTLTVPANATRIFIQYGKVTTRHGFNRQDQHCELEVNQIKDHEQKILPDHFTITKVRIGNEMVANRLTKNQPVMLAQADTGIMSDTQIPWQNLVADTTDNNRPETMDTVMLYLKPTHNNPNIFRLTCAGSLSNGDLQDAPRSYRPEKAEINTILGSIGHLN